MIESSKAVKPWREDVRTATERAMYEQFWTPDDADQALAVDLVFWLRRPLGHPKTRRTNPITKPDIDKLARSTLDALTSGGALHDDARVVRLTTRKRYVHPERLRRPEENDRTGATIHIRPDKETES